MVSHDRLHIVDYFLNLTTTKSLMKERSSVSAGSVNQNRTFMSAPVPPLPVPTNVGGAESLEEPHRITGSTDGMNFSLPTRMVRTPPFGTPVIPVRNSGNFTPISGLTGSTDPVAREGLMLRAYSDTATTHELTTYDEAAIKDTIKKHVVSVVKFVKSERAYPSFWQPNLLQDPPSYVDAFFDYYGNKYKDRKIDEVVLVEAVRLWKAAAPKLKKHIDNHRAGVAQKMKSDIMPGELLNIYSYIVLRYS